MNYPRNFLFSAIFFCVSLSTVQSAEREDLYAIGKAAYEKRDYVTALKSLYAFYMLNEDSLGSHPELKKSLEAKIKTAESILATAMASNSKLTLSKDTFTIRSETIGGGFSGTGKEIQELIETGKIDLKKISQKNHSMNSK